LPTNIYSSPAESQAYLRIITDEAAINIMGTNSIFIELAAH
jgi:hypothetical protein